MKLNLTYQLGPRAARFALWTLVVELGVIFLAYILLSIPAPPLESDTKVMQRHIAYLENRQETLDLAIEFGFDPVIVDVTRELAHNTFRDEYAKRKKLTWRFIKTEHELTYMILSLIQTESHGDPRAINVPNGPSSGIGLTQLILSTARLYDRSVNQQELQTIPVHLKIAVHYFVDLLEKYNGNYTLAVLAWNRGPGTVDRVIALGNSPENGYARAVFEQAAVRNSK